MNYWSYVDLNSLKTLNLWDCIQYMSWAQAPNYESTCDYTKL